jgi:hypothetical protein
VDAVAGVSSGVREQPLHLPPGRLQRLPEKSKSSTKVRRLVLLAIAGLVGLGVFIGLLSLVKKTLQSFSAPPLEGEQPLVQLAQPPVPIPEAGSQMMAPEGLLTKETAQQVIQAWLATKSLALGRNHEVAQLEQILANPALSTWRQRAQTAKQENSYWQYKHALEVKSVQTSDAYPDQARVEAAVNEAAQFYQDGQIAQASSYNDNLRVQYDLVRKEGRWFIKDMAVVR